MLVRLFPQGEDSVPVGLLSIAHGFNRGSRWAGVREETVSTVLDKCNKLFFSEMVFIGEAGGQAYKKIIALVNYFQLNSRL